jgi:hypothetical protein
MTSAEFAMHVAYWRREPTGPAGQMVLWAALMAATANGALMRRDKRLFKGEDFWPGTQWTPPPKPEPLKPGQKKPRMAPDFSHLRGLKVRGQR